MINESLTKFKDEDGEEEDDQGRDHSASPVLRQSCSDCIGMGSYCEDQKLEADGISFGDGDKESLEAPSDVVNNSSTCISENENTKLFDKVAEIKEECQEALGAVKENAHLRLEQLVEVTDNEKEYHNIESSYIGNAKKLDVEMSGLISEENFEQLRVLNAVNIDAREHIIDVNVSERKDSENLLAREPDIKRMDSELQKEIGHLGSKHAEVVEANMAVLEKDLDDFHGLSSLRTTGIATDVGPLSSVVFDSDQVRNECEDAMPLVSSKTDCFQNCEANCAVGTSACFTSVNSSCDDDANTCGGRNDSNSSSIVVLRRKNPKRGASLRSNLADGKSDQISKARNNRRNDKKPVYDIDNIDPTFLLSAIRLSDQFKRKRSCPQRSQHTSIWGQFENVTKVFEHYAKFENYDNIDDLNKKPKKGRSAVDYQKRSKSQKDGNFQVSSAKQSDAEHKNMQAGDKDMESSLTQEVSVDLGECLGFSSLITPEIFVETGTSPDSDVYHPSDHVLETKVSVMTCEDATSANQNISGMSQIVLGVGTSYITALPVPMHLNSKKGKMKATSPIHQIDGTESKSKRSSKNSNSKQKTQKCSNSVKTITENGSTSNSAFFVEAPVPEIAESEYVEESSQLKRVFSGQDVSSSQSEVSIQAEKAKGQRRQKVHGQIQMNKYVQKSDDKGSEAVEACTKSSDYMNFSCETTNTSVTIPTQPNCNINEGKRVVPEEVGPNETLEQPRMAWVLCDDCEKWRCISVELANSLEETNSKWTCKDNTDKAFSDCSIPQEKTNAEINAELGIPDEDDPSSMNPSSNGVELSSLTDVAASQRDSWTPIKSNVFLHRSHRTQNIDEIMVCHCKPPRDGRGGCGDQCLNRMLNIECVKGTCPCQDLCSNQRFQKRKYAKFKWTRCGKKGYGLQLQEDVFQGQFLIEYVGEVLDIATYEARQRFYASRGQKHFYFMTLNGGEVIDACAKGNLGRFVNHSCEPNCRTEKWMVNGEVCIGLFAMRDIKKDEEVTFDYNYERVFGAAAKKCICGSLKCRGYLGGDPLNSEIIVDSDEDDIEPIILHDKHKTESTLNDHISINSEVAKKEDILLKRKDVAFTYSPAISEPEVSAKIKSHSLYPLENSMTSQPLENSKQCLNSVQSKENMSKPIPKIKPREISTQNSTTIKDCQSDLVINSQKSLTKLLEVKQNTAKPNSHSKSSCLRGKIKMDRASIKNLVSHKTKTSTLGAGACHFEGVEEKLNVLLDRNGGISKQKDSTRGYLKLLVVTAVEGDVGGSASQSARDLSLILDAILKTRSRKVLMDIINKNGLQMLHNLIKQNRLDFNRIPIIRKLLKVLEFLALTGILTPELINKDPPCNGIESFKQSIGKLTGHNDKQIHKTAREFRDKYIPRKIKRLEPSDRDNLKTDRQLPQRSWNKSSEHVDQHTPESRDTDAIIISAVDIPSSSTELNTSNETVFPLLLTDNNSPAKSRKRKSRWDNSSDINENQIVEAAPNHTNGEDFCKLDDLMQIDDEGPPGFEKYLNNSQVSSDTALVTNEVVGYPQNIYYSYMPMSFGIPVDLMDHLGTLEFGENSGNQNWAIAPGMPYHPYPPLPAYPREQERKMVANPASNSADNGYRKSVFKGRLRFPDKKFDRAAGRSGGLHRRFCHNRFDGNMRNGPHNFAGGNMRRNTGKGFCPPNSMNSNYNAVGSNLHRPYN